MFDVVTSESFLIDLLKESRNQNATITKLLKVLPDELGKNISKALTETTIPYLENILFSLNLISDSVQRKNGADVVDKLF